MSTLNRRVVVAGMAAAPIVNAAPPAVMATGEDREAVPEGWFTAEDEGYAERVYAVIGSSLQSMPAKEHVTRVPMPGDEIAYQKLAVVRLAPADALSPYGFPHEEGISLTLSPELAAFWPLGAEVEVIIRVKS